MTEQWKGDGICKECRRQSYCKTQCSASKQRIKTITSLAIRSKLGIDKIEAALAVKEDEHE